MPRFNTLSLAVLALALAAPAASAQTPGALDRPALDAPSPLPEDARTIGTDTSAPTVAYQGTLSDGGAPVADGSYTVAVGLFGGATSNQAQYHETHSVTTVGGAFSLAIGGGTPTTGTYDAVTFADETWLEIAVGGTTLGPRTLLQAAPHARSLTAGAEVSGEVSGGAALSAENTSATSFSSGVFGLSPASTGTTYGVHGRSNSTSGQGVYGYAGATSGNAYGVQGRSHSSSGSGVYGLADASSGTTHGVFGSSTSPNGRGVYGYAVASTGTTFGLYGQSLSTSGRGAYASADAGSGTTYGLYARSQSTAGRAVYGLATASSGSTHGVWGRSISPDGTGVFGENTSASGITYGVRGLSTSTTGLGVFGETTSASGITYGVHGASASTSGRGVYGETTSGTGATFGVYGLSASTSGTGLRGSATAASGTAYGVYGQSASANGLGVFGYASAASGTTYGVYGSVVSPTGYPGYFVGGQGLYVDAADAGHGAEILSDGGSGSTTATVFAENTSTSNGIAGWFESNGSDAALVAHQRGFGDILRAVHNNNLRFRVQNNGNVRADGSFSGGGADLAEYFPLADGADVAPGQVVGLTAGRVSLSTDGAEQVAVISSNPAFVGNPDAEAGGALVALVGQVAVDVSGDAAPGDLLIASGTADGRARAVSPQAYTPADGAVLGRVLSADDGRVVALVGVDEAAALRGVVQRQAAQIDALTARLARLEALFTP